MADVKVLKKEKPAQDEVGRKKNVCPWCNYANKDETKGPIHEKEDSEVANAGYKWQCLTCGKNWQVTDLGKLWSEALEKGTAWAKEMQIRGLNQQ